jgi:hypothetical protein
MPRYRAVIVGREDSGCGCLIGGIVVLALIAGIVVYGFTGATWVGIHVYSYFNNNNEPGAYETRPDYFYGCAGLLFVFGIGAVISMIFALLGRSRGAVWTTVIFFVLAVAAFAVTVILYNTYIKPLSP